MSTANHTVSPETQVAAIPMQCATGSFFFYFFFTFYFLVETLDISFLLVDILTDNYKEQGISPAVKTRNFTAVVILSYIYSL